MKKDMLLILVCLLAMPVLGLLLTNGGTAEVSESYPRGSRDALLKVGRQLAGDGDALLYVSEEQPSPAMPVLLNRAETDFPLEKMVALNLMGFKVPASVETGTLQAQQLSAGSSQSARVIAEENAARADAAEDFLERQAVFGGHAVPASVDCSAPALPFEYEKPVSAETTSLFGYRVHPIYGDVRFHYGTDFNVSDGDNIYAFSDGTVETTGTISGYGLTLVINHSDGFSTLYAHCSELLVSQGDTVSAGQLVALSGHSGQVTGPHLHFELKKDGMYLNPEFYL